MGRGFTVTSAPPLTLAGWLRHDVIRRLLQPLDAEAVLEIGAGEGALAVRLARAYDYVGVEPDPVARDKAKSRLARLGRGQVLSSLEDLGDARRFDVVCAFEVLEHIADEHAALSSWQQRLRPEGRLLLSVPAGESRYGAADRLVGHYRRYEPQRVQQVLADGGFSVERIEYVGMPLGYVLEALRHLLASRMHDADASPEARSGASGRWLQPPEGLAWATRLFTAPFRKLEHVLPSSLGGTNLLVLARVAK
jgi:SAM-dependent methyltransferase